MARPDQDSDSRSSKKEVMADAAAKSEPAARESETSSSSYDSEEDLDDLEVMREYIRNQLPEMVANQLSAIEDNVANQLKI